MRIIGGRLKGIHLRAPEKLPVRPTTDMAKEALFNILNNTYDIDECTVLDLFCGTGNISVEFASRGAASILSVDAFSGCIRWINDVIKRYDLQAITPVKSDVFKFLQAETEKYNIIFADPPYDMPQIPDIAKLVFSRDLLTANGLLVIEHPVFLKLHNLEGYSETRSYGNSAFSFFKQQVIAD